MVAASGTFGRPHRPALPGLDGFSGTLLHTADYRNPKPFAGQRIVVVGRAIPRCRSLPNSPAPQRSRSRAGTRSSSPASASLAATCTSG
ncbi:hypothetical protein SAZ11_05085 [Streptomyces sp. FXJ1.4098]|nr:hypothetical protein [Streptomyces sp. FXJ1.4098]